MTRRSTGRDLTILALLAALAYAPALALPLIEDDYPNLTYALQHGAPAVIAGLLHDPIFRVRATSAWLMYGLWRVFGLAPGAFHAASLVLHVANCWLVYGIVGEIFGPRMDTDGHGYKSARLIALSAAAFFAVYEGHQEAVMWFSACNELLAFLFGAGALLLWMRGRWVASATVFALALISKESAVVWLALFVAAAGIGATGLGPGAGASWRAPRAVSLTANGPKGRTFAWPLAPDPWARAYLLQLLPHVLLAAAAIAAVWMTRNYSFRFSDGSFSLDAPFWITWPRGLVRLMWPWGWAALAAVLWLRVKKGWRRALLWMGIALLPYSFLTYSTQIPSRQTYLASAGLALLVGTGMAHLPDRRVLAVAVIVAVGVNVGYLWTRKRAQFVERARPTEELIRLANQTSGPIYVQCFPRNRLIAEEAVHIGAGKPPEMLRWESETGAVTFCYQTSR